MNKSVLGLIFALGFVLIESLQFVYFGGLFQRVNSFLFGFLVFGLTVFLFVGWALLKSPQQLKNALTIWRDLIAVNLGAVVSFTAYLLSVQMLEPVITYTISSGTMPLAAYLFYRLGFREGSDFRNRYELFGNSLIFLSIIFLAVVTLSGYSGFVRGDSTIALLGVFLAILDGVFFTLILVYSQRLSVVGVGPGAVLGLRLPLYVLVTGAIASGGFGIGHSLTTSELIFYVIIGFSLSIPPLYLLQRAVATLSTLTISTLTALGPLVIFGLQILEDRVVFSLLTVIGLIVYVTGAMAAALGAVKASTQR